MLVELKNGETYNGHLASCDAWMNIHLTQVICTSRDGDRFWKMPECFIRGSTIKYLRIPDEVVDNFKEDSNKPNYKGRGNDSGGGHGGRGGGSHSQRGGRPSGNARGGSANRGGSSGRASMSSSASSSSINKAKQQRRQ